jgi:hypothetical protein
MNKIKGFLLLFLCITVIFVNAQDVKVVSLEYDGQKISYNAFNGLKPILESNLSGITIGNNSIIVVQPSLKHTGLKTIEGMDTKKVGKSVLSLKLKNLITLRDTILKLNVEVAGKNENELDGEVVRQLMKDQKLLSSINNILSEYCNEVSNKISNHVGIIRENEVVKDIHVAMQQTYKLEATLGKPNPEVQKLKLELKGKYDKQVCEKSLYDAKILINSGVEYQMNRAVNLLLQIPPSAACRAEALKLSDELFSKMKTSNINKEKLEKYKKLMQQNNENLWIEMIE